MGGRSARVAGHDCRPWDLWAGARGRSASSAPMQWWETTSRRQLRAEQMMGGRSARAAGHD
eukprot:901850-Rhodomonas_salina.1